MAPAERKRRSSERERRGSERKRRSKGQNHVDSPRLALRRPLCGAGALLVVLAAVLLSGAAQAQSRLEAHFLATVAGIQVGQGVWVIDIGDDQYAAAASGRVTGILRAVASGEGQAAARGSLNGGRPVPATFAVKVSTEDKSDDVRMSFAAGAVKEVVAEPPLVATPDRVPVTEAHRRGVLDPMTAGLMPVAGSGDLLAPEACQRTLAIFDGRMRFDLTLAFKRMEKVHAEKGYDGPVAVCGVTYQPVAGHRPGRYAIKYLQEAHDMEIWLAPVSGTRMLVPFRISLPTLIGTAVLQATQFVAVAQPRPLPKTMSSSKTQ
jgi:hypothetical protein